MIDYGDWTVLGEDDYVINADERYTVWEHPDTQARLYLETEPHPDLARDEYFIAWIERDGR